MSDEVPIGVVHRRTSETSDSLGFFDAERHLEQPRRRLYISQRPGIKRFSGPIGGWSKRVFDLIVSATLLLFLFPVLLAIAVAVRAERRNVVIFRQARTGFDGKPFKIYKFRTMRVCENKDVVQARPGDARITPVGGFLRRTSLDELPQLVNVFRGEMSLVGPRPHALDHDADFEDRNAAYSQRRVARPGITGLAQISGARGTIETDDDLNRRVYYDTAYVQEWSFFEDLRILFGTIWAVLKKDGAV